MQVTETIHKLKIAFSLPVAPGKTLERFANMFIINTEKLVLVDTGVKGAKDIAFKCIESLGRKPEEIDTLVITHAHPDHIGGALGIKQATGCKIAAHSDAVAWIEDTELQFKQRPVPGDIPVYDDVPASLESIRKLRAIKGLKILLPAWDEPQLGNKAYTALDNGMQYMQKIHTAVLKSLAGAASADVPALAAKVVAELGLPPAALNPLFFRVIEAHLRLRDRATL
jgi:hypothetical protein